MNRRDEEYLFECIEDIKSEVHENNKMLRQICGAINTYLANHQRENDEDFGRNVLANLISSSFEVGKIRRY